MAKITDLPPELLRTVWDFVAVKDVDDFSFVCREIQHAGLAHINEHWHCRKKYTTTTAKIVPTKIALSRNDHSVSVPLLDKAMELRIKPMRAEYIQTLVVGRLHQPDLLKWQEQQPECSDEYLDRLEKMIEECIWIGSNNQSGPDLEGQLTEEWERGMRYAGDTFLLIYLLLVCPLQVLNINIQCHSIKFILDAVRYSPYKPKECVLNKVHEVIVDVTDVRTSPSVRITFDDLIALAEIPSLKTIWSRNISPTNDRSHELFKEPIKSNVTKLVLVDNTEPDPAVMRFISAFDYLESFTMMSTKFGVGQRGFSEERIMSVLRARSEYTLESLTIHNLRFQRRWMGSIKEFTFLTYLSTDWRCLIDMSDADRYLPDYLPPSLKTLLLKVEHDFDSNNEKEHICRLIAAKKTTHQALVHCELLGLDSRWSNMRGMRLFHEAEEMGLKFFFDVQPEH